MSKVLLRFLVLSVVAVTAMLSLVPRTQTASAAPPPDPNKVILFVHGYAAACTGGSGGAGCDDATLEATYGPLFSFLEGQGYTVYRPVLPGNDNVINGEFLDSYILNTIIPDLQSRGVTIDSSFTVKVLAHSMGGLSARYCEKSVSGCDALITEDIALDVPENGAVDFCLNADDNGGQMCPTSDFLTALNAPDATPGAGPWVQFNGPLNTTRLSGMDCYVSVPRKYDHLTFLFQPDVQANILTHS